jgi:hypothetical protein
MNISLRDFQPINHWEADQNREKWKVFDHDSFSMVESSDPKFIIDKTTNRKYLNDSPSTVRWKCLALIFVTPFERLFNIIWRIMKVANFANFWLKVPGEGRYDIKARLIETAKDLFRIITTPMTLVGLELAAIYGMLRPYDGRKLYASIDRATFGTFGLAPCFQPDPKRHGLGGNINHKDVF